MTVPIERTNAVKMTADFLRDLCDPKKTQRVPKWIRREAHYCLRHYPSHFEMDIIAHREDVNSHPLGYKIFGNDYK